MGQTATNQIELAYMTNRYMRSRQCRYDNTVHDLLKYSFDRWLFWLTKTDPETVLKFYRRYKLSLHGGQEGNDSYPPVPQVQGRCTRTTSVMTAVAGAPRAEVPQTSSAPRVWQRQGQVPQLVEGAGSGGGPLVG